MRIVTRDQGSLALIFHIFDPHDDGSERKGVGCQVFTPLGTFSRESRVTSRFRAQSHRLDVRNDFPAATSQPYDDFFRLTTHVASGRITSQGNTTVDFDFDIHPQVGWGTSERQYSVAGFLAVFPVFEPHYQVLLSRGKVQRGSLRVTGATTQDDNDVSTVYNLKGATVYMEKNWGGSFPSKWFWIQANTFVETTTNSTSDLCVTSTGGLRRLPFSFKSTGQEEEVALIALHWNGRFLPFPEVEWSIEWGKWTVRGTYQQYIVELQGTCRESSGFPVNCPTKQGMAEIAMETFQGELRVRLFEKGGSCNSSSKDSCSGRIVLDAVDNQACLEIGGLPWSDRMWVGVSAMKEPIKSIAMNVDVENKASDLLQLWSNFIEIPGL